jgi:uncharacterized protein (DUF58 family)
MEKRERIYIVFHWAGLLFAFSVLFIFAMGFGFPNSRGLTQIFGIALVVAGVVTLIQSNNNLRGVEIAGCRALPVPAGEDVVLELTLRNTSGQERTGLWVREGRSRNDWWRRRPRRAAWVPVLEANESAVVRLRLPTTRRGRFTLPVLWVSSVMPVGLCFAWKVFPDCGEYVVYPKPKGRPLGEGFGAGEEEIGRAGVRDRDSSEDVSGHRPYQPGDILARLDWRVFARTGNLLVRAMEEGGGDEVVLRWRDTEFLNGEESRLEQLSFWMMQCVHEGRTFTMDLGSGRGEINGENLAACQEALATFTEKKNGNRKS